jgi:hypothetical protein
MRLKSVQARLASLRELQSATGEELSALINMEVVYASANSSR